MMPSRLQEALAANRQVWGGWVVGPTAIGPEEFAGAGYHYVGFDLQHGYLDDADVAMLLRRLLNEPPMQQPMTRNRSMPRWSIRPS